MTSNAFILKPLNFLIEVQIKTRTTEQSFLKAEPANLTKLEYAKTKRKTYQFYSTAKPVSYLDLNSTPFFPYPNNGYQGGREHQELPI